uniref:putative deoxyribonuclease tatdn3 isoform X2 n=1 Tax=Scatophagus argus TaxID=75038 RepID=UPI001ED84237|nr:putative deoxyribonuclease tatdn3 isoform X2 [Scatophagus argus]
MIVSYKVSARMLAMDLGDVIQRTTEAGVETLVAVTEEVREFSRVLQLQERYPDLVAPCFGVHPLQGIEGPERRSVKPQLLMKKAFPQDLDVAVPQFYKHSERLVAVGEIGLDFTPWCAPTQQDRDDQMKVFIKQLDVAKELDLPVNVHSRSAAKVTIATMRERGVGRALLHNFAGKPSVALEGVRAGYLFSFPPAVCRNQQRDKLIQQIPLEHICLETDSPALGLDQHVRNEPANIVLSCRYIADVKGLPPQTVQLVTTQNAKRLFPKMSRKFPSRAHPSQPVIARHEVKRGEQVSNHSQSRSTHIATLPAPDRPMQSKHTNRSASVSQNFLRLSSKCLLSGSLAGGDLSLQAALRCGPAVRAVRRAGLVRR